jgi:nucleoside-diphosphate-sugar epimerase
MSKRKILVTGASGQVGQELYRHLVSIHGEDQIIASDIYQLDGFAKFEYMDITNQHKIREVVQRHKIDEIYHLAAILSANAEKNPTRAWEINMSGLLNILEVSVEFNLKRIFFPSSIAVFGNHANLELTGQFDVQHPTTLYGISKSAGENWCQYYHEKYDLDIRSLRYPGIIGHSTLPGGGTTDYAVHIYHEALKNKSYTCYVHENTVMPMIYMEDAMQATVDLMAAEKADITIWTSYNIQALSFSPKEIAASIQKFIPDFTIKYAPDDRQHIADNWPRKLRDEQARNDWGWHPTYDLEKMTKEMFDHLSPKY